MSSTNPYYTINYSQPTDYHFSHDSVFLARETFEIVKMLKKMPTQVLDLCAGCGVVGIDYLHHLNKNSLGLPDAIDFVEVQSVYNSHFIKNITSLHSEIKKMPDYNFLNINYDSLMGLQYKKKYDLILCNPPYFYKQHGLLSESDFKNRCRFFIDSNFENLIKSIDNSLAIGGSAYLLIQPLTEHKLMPEVEIKKLKTSLTADKLGKIRDTDFYKLTKT